VAHSGNFARRQSEKPRFISSSFLKFHWMFISEADLETYLELQLESAAGSSGGHPVRSPAGASARNFG
jgi:hypothetical protein